MYLNLYSIVGQSIFEELHYIVVYCYQDLYSTEILLIMMLNYEILLIMILNYEILLIMILYYEVQVLLIISHYEILLTMIP